MWKQVRRVRSNGLPTAANAMRLSSRASSITAKGLVGNGIIAVRRETMNRWERRTPLTPNHVRKLVREGYNVIIQPSNMRYFTDDLYMKAGASVKDDISMASVILGIQKVPIEELIPNKTYLFFSHTIKGQPSQMQMLDAILAGNIRLIDYERMVDSQGKRVIGFGRFAGYAGMIDLLRGLGDRLLGLGYTSPFLGTGYTDYYHSLAAARTGMTLVGNNIQIVGVPKDFAPLIVGFTGSGKVATGAIEMFRELPHEFISVSDLESVVKSGDSHVLYGVKLSREDIVQPIDPEKTFDREEYIKYPSLYRPVFHEKVAPYLSALVNCMYWDDRYPRLLTNQQLRTMYERRGTRLLAVSDIAADIRGSIEFTKYTTRIDRPFTVYNPTTDTYSDDWEANGILLGAVPNLSAEFPRGASEMFGDILLEHVKELAYSNGSLPWEQQTDISPTLHNATITSGGELTPNYKYIEDIRRAYDAAIAKTKKHVLLLGSGMVTEPLVEYLSLNNSNISITIGSLDSISGAELAKKFPRVEHVLLNVTTDTNLLRQLVANSDIVVSLLPAPLHPPVASLCVDFKKNMVTTSYISPAMQALHSKAKAAGITILNEIGLDPGIDHLTAMQIIDSALEVGGQITSFKSWCGGLPSPDASHNALGYKFSWSARGVLAAGLNGARFRENGKEIRIKAGSLFDNARSVQIYPGLSLEGLPNRDSLDYQDVYKIRSAKTVLRGTLRYQGFSDTMSMLNKFGLFEETPSEVLQQCRQAGEPVTWATFANNLAISKGYPDVREYLNATYGAEKAKDYLGKLQSLQIVSGAHVSPTANTTIDALAALLVTVLKYEEGETDLVLLCHEFEITFPNGHKEHKRSTLYRTGTPRGQTAMSVTVGLPAAIATQLILKGDIQRKGVIRPVTKDIYDPILKRLQQLGLNIVEETF